MRYEVQVHFENCGQLQWHEDIVDPENWLGITYETPTCTAWDEETDRHIAFNMNKVTAIILTPKSRDEDDLFRRAYATQKGNEQEDDRYQYKGNGSQRPPKETGDRRGIESSPESWR